MIYGKQRKPDLRVIKLRNFLDKLLGPRLSANPARREAEKYIYLIDQYLISKSPGYNYLSGKNKMISRSINSVRDVVIRHQTLCGEKGLTLREFMLCLKIGFDEHLKDLQKRGATTD